MKRPYYIMTSGRLRRKDNTIYFEPHALFRRQAARLLGHVSVELGQLVQVGLGPRRELRPTGRVVNLNNVRSTPRRAVYTVPASAPVKPPPNPAPLLCRITLTMSRTEIIISAIFK